MATTVGQILVNECLPPKFRDYGRVLDSNGIEDLLRRVASEAPEEYSDVSKKLMDVGGDAAFDTGVTLRLADCETKFDKRPYFDIVDQAEDAIEADKTMSYKDKLKALGEVYDKVQGSIQKSVMDAELKSGNQLALQVASKARGSPGQLMSFISTPGTFPDNNGNTVPMFIRHSFAEGLTPAEYWAGSYGARTSTTTGKMATAKGGAFGKLLSQSANNQVIVTEDCGGTSGVPMPISDDDNMGALLAQKTGKYPAGTIITKSVLSDLRKDKKLDEIVIRSPMTCGCKSGVCSKCAGVRETGGLPPIGYNLGTNAASAFAERITQGALNCLAEGTLVRMADGTCKPIEEVNPGDYVLGSDLECNISPTKVVARYDQGIQPCVRTEFVDRHDRHIFLDSTTEHPVLGFLKTGKTNDTLSYGMFKVGTEAFCAFARTASPESVADASIRFLHETEPSGKADTESYMRATQTDIGDRHCYDLEVECHDHIYLLKNGLIVHNTKHSGRLASGAGQYQGFAMFTSMAKVPKSYPDKATISSVDGEVTEIKDAPQGGKYVVVNDGSKDQEHYVPVGYDIMVKPGDRLEAGDQISDGVINPAELVQYKGIGEARKYWAQRFTQGIRDSGMKGNRRNAEVLAKTLINNVELDEECEAGFPGDVTTYTKWAYGFKPRKDSKMLKPEQANGMYLEQPVLHYTIGTRITPSVAKTLSKFGHKQILVNQNIPGAIPFMQRVEDSNAVRDDWMARLGTTYLKDRIVEDAQRGAESHLHSTEPNPGLAKGVEFGNWGKPGSKNKSPEFTY